MNEELNDDDRARAANPDIRMRSNGSAESRAPMFITKAGEEFVRAVAAKTKGVWHEDEQAYWMHDCLFPFDDLEASRLRIVAGIGTDAGWDVPWPYR